MSRTRAETQQWKARFEGEGLVAIDELEAERRKRQEQMAAIEDALAEVQAQIVNVERKNAKLVRVYQYLMGMELINS